jgi:UDP-glucose 4-epimerase
MKYIITGGAGFIGSHLADALLAQGREVMSIDNLSTGDFGNISNAIKTHPTRFKFVECDINNASKLDSLIDQGDIIFHLAATVGVKKVCLDPNETWTNNFYPTQVLLDIAARKRCRIIFTSTSEVYGDIGKVSIKETDPCTGYTQLGGRSAYILGKMMSEHVCFNARQTLGTEVIVARLFNTTGLRQSAHFGMVIPTFISQALHSKDITVFGDGTQTRSFADVRDSALALIQLSDCNDALGEIINIGNPNPVTITELAETIISITGSRSRIVYTAMPSEREGHKDITHRQPDIAKLTALTHCVANFELPDIIEHIVRDYNKSRINFAYRH